MTRRAVALPLLSLAIACGGADIAPRPSDVSPRAVDQPELSTLLARYDAMQPGAERDRLALRIDKVAGQRYAVWSRLSWHRDLDDAIAASRATGKPILSLRMLGALDKDLSCANSRFFRVALYANQDVSAYLREHFILHWSSERPVPVARIDFGDGRVLERTIAGNSAHYVLDQRGRPVDVLPGLYSPALFLEVLERARPLAVRAGSLDDAALADDIAAYHGAWAQEGEARFASLGTIRQPGDTTIAAAEMRAVSKAAVEMPVVRELRLGSDLALDAAALDRSSQTWSQIGALLAGKVGPARLDDRSRALFAALKPADWARAGQPLPAAGIDQLIATFEEVMTRDAAYNELVLHHQIHAQLAARSAATPIAFAELNRWVYASLFRTPAEDPWLGMATPEVFSGIPNDGIVMR
jgi:hypothetical protein